MKFVLLVKVTEYGAKKFKERGPAALAKIKSLGFDVEKIKMVYTQGAYDLVEVVEAPSAEAMLAHTTWYAKQGYGKMIAMPAHDPAVMKRADALAGKR
jgi:uncharacterized protein with GYD domain